MNHTKSKTICFLLFLSIFNFQTQEVLANVRYYVHVVNFLSDNTQPLRIHCASGDNDLGYHDLAIKQDFQWSFHVNYFVHSTLYFCHFWWGAKQASFDVFNKTWAPNCNRVHKGDKFCFWLVKDDGFYFTGTQHNDVPGPFAKIRDW